MLVESNPLLDASSFDREREVRKHVGDFTLFFTGLFPKAVASLPRLRPFSIDTFIDYVSAGKESYAVVAAFNLFEYRLRSVRSHMPLIKAMPTVLEVGPVDAAVSRVSALQVTGLRVLLWEGI